MSYQQTIGTLPNGRKVTIREPEGSFDRDRIYRFLSRLPASVRSYLRYDVADRELFDWRMDQLDGTSHWRLIAEVDGKIAADATMDREPFGWARHVAQLRAVQASEFDGLGLRELLIHELSVIARGTSIGRLSVEVLAEQADLIAALEKMGFEQEAVRRQYARDLAGQLHDVVLLSNDLAQVWEQLEELIDETDICIERATAGE